MKNLDSETKKLTATSFDVSARVNSLLKPHIEKANEKKLSLEVKYFLSNSTVELDQGMFDVILNNIVGNAVKYTDEGVVNVSLVDERAGTSNSLLLVVKDTGPGIPPEKHAQIFEEFRQVDEGIRRNFEGVGLGLSLVRKYVEACGGSIELESFTGKGSIFTIKLPLLGKPEPAETAPVSPVAPPAVVTSEGKPPILIVEDDHVNAEVAQYYLRNRFEVHIAADGETALKKATELNFPVILMDINLGKGLSGVDVTMELRRRDAYRDIPIIACTAFAMESDRTSFLEAGCTHYLVKHYKRHDLLEVLKQACPWLPS